MKGDDTDYEVVWNGGELLPAREQKPHHTWIIPKRLWNKKDVGEQEPPLDSNDCIHSGINKGGEQENGRHESRAEGRSIGWNVTGS